MLFENIERKYIVDILRLLRGSVIIQAVQLVGTFILTFYFKKEDFGALSFLLSVSLIFEMVAGLQYNNAAVVAHQQKNVFKLMLISVLCAMSFSFLLLIGIVLLKFLMPGFYTDIYFNGLIMALPLFIISNYIFNNGILLLKYFGEIKHINNFRVLYVSVSLTAKLIAALLFGTVESLVYAHLLGIVITAFIVTLRFNTTIVKTLKQLTVSESFFLIKENYRFPKYSIFSSIVSTVSTVSFPILVTLFFGLQENGIFYLTTIFVFQPLLLILQSIGDAFLPKVKVIFHESKPALLNFINKQQLIILKFLIPYFIIAVLAGEFLIQYLLPAHWTEIGRFVKFQIIFYLFTSLYAPFSIVADFMKKQQFLMMFNISHFLFQFAILFFLHDVFHFNYVILIAAIASAIHYGYINFYMLRKLKLHQ